MIDPINTVSMRLIFTGPSARFHGAASAKVSTKAGSDETP